MSKRPIPQLINSLYVYNASHLRDYDPEFFYGCSKSVRKIIEKKNIPEKHYFYAVESKGAGIQVYPNDKPPKKAKLFISTEWADTHMKSPELPPVLELHDNEKFIDEGGDIVEIECRGERKYNEVYFLAKDVSSAFSMPNLSSVITNKNRSGMIENEHYTVFVRKGSNNDKSRTNKHIYLTYKGILKILFSSRSGNACKFVDWASGTLFAHQMGTEQQKLEIAANALGVSLKAMKDVFGTSATNIPCIYEIALGSVGGSHRLRDSMGISNEIPDEYVIVKYGYTKDLLRRMGEHKETYSQIPGVSLELMTYCYVDQKFLAQAERDIRSFFADIEIPIKYANFNELVAINPNHIPRIKKQFNYINQEYSGNVKDLIEKLLKFEYELENKNKEIIHQREVIGSKDEVIKGKDEIISTFREIISLRSRDIDRV